MFWLKQKCPQVNLFIYLFFLLVLLLVGSTFVNINSHKKAVLFSHQSMHRYTVNLLVEIHTMYTQLVVQQVILFSEFGT